jgi:membrane-associated protease RseP (regulator of RpoE activity)
MAVIQLTLPKFSYADGSCEIGRFARAPIRVHPLFFVAAAALTAPYWVSMRWSGFALGLIGMISVLVSVLLHELAHAQVARRFGVSALRIDLDLFGGVVEFWNRPRTLRQHLAIVLAGPLSNLVLAAVAFVLLTAIGKPEPEPILIGGQSVPSPFQMPGLAARALTFAMYLNCGLFVVNLLPAFPLDGGKLAFLLIARRGDRRLATVIVGGLGVVLSMISWVVLLMTTLAGRPVWSPPGFRQNWEAVQVAWRGGSVDV